MADYRALTGNAQGKPRAFWGWLVGLFILIPLIVSHEGNEEKQVRNKIFCFHFFG